ncbi:MAG TPA: diacylglycerol kinase family protein [Xanthomonadales bacterium]|nr:diacylglycerol kinase family protein [Xanthomonadales bacterium]
MKLLLVFNPLAAGGRAGRRLPAIRERMQASGVEADVQATSHSGHAEELVREADLTRIDAVVVAGGDGTLSQALNGLMTHPAKNRRPLGLIPVGTGNAFSRDIGLDPDAWLESVDAIVKGTTRSVDIGKVETHSDTFYFLNIAGFGFVTDAGRTAAKLKFAGKSAYTLATLWRCLRLRSHLLELEVDGQVIRQENLLAEVSNSRYTGTSFLIAPGAKIHDGLLDIVLVRKLSRLRLLRLFPTIYKGEHIKYKEVETLQGRVITISSPDGLELMVDGEFRSQTPVRIECLPSEIDMFVP